MNAKSGLNSPLVMIDPGVIRSVTLTREVTIRIHTTPTADPTRVPYATPIGPI